MNFGTSLMRSSFSFSERAPHLLPCDGAAIYFPKIISPVAASQYLDKLITEIEWRQDELIIMGRNIKTRRKVAWYGQAGLEYKYSGMTKKALAWTPCLLELKEISEGVTGAHYNSCLLNLYHDGTETMGWHADNEPEIEENSSIASISLGQSRNFLLKHRRSKEQISIVLENGSLLEMKEEIQKFWVHSLPRSPKTMGMRVNLTFRKMKV